MLNTSTYSLKVENSSFEFELNYNFVISNPSYYYPSFKFVYINDNKTFNSLIHILFVIMNFQDKHVGYYGCIYF